MLPTAGLLALTLVMPSTASAIHVSVGNLPPLAAPAVLAANGHGASLELHSTLLERASTIEQRAIEGDRLAQRRRHHQPASTGATNPPSDSAAPASTAPASAPPASPPPAEPEADEAAAPASAAPSGEPAASEAPAEEASAAPAEEEEPSIDLIRQREHMVRIHRPLGIATWASLLATEAMGTIMLINDRSMFGPGLCSTLDANGNPQCIFGNFGTPGGGLNAVHEVEAFITLGLYTATGIYALGMPDPEHAAAGQDARGSRLRIHRTLAWVHLIGMVVQPILGIIAARPDFVGVTGPASQDFSADMRTIHMGVGYVTFAALTAAMIDELIQ